MIKDSEYSLEAIAENEQLFNMLISTSCINYRYTNYYHNNVSASKNVNLEQPYSIIAFGYPDEDENYLGLIRM